MMGDPLGSSRVSSQKQNSEGVVGAQSGQYHVTVESSPGCGGGPGRDVTAIHLPLIKTVRTHNSGKELLLIFTYLQGVPRPLMITFAGSIEQPMARSQLPHAFLVADFKEVP
ncbi:hypothetical protein COP2_013833 [Malus domestica]